MFVTILEWVFRSQKVQSKGLKNVKTKNQAFCTVQLLQPCSKNQQLRAILVISSLAEYQIKLLNIRLSRQFSGYTRYFFWYFFWWCAFTLLDWDLQRANIQTKGLQIQTKTQAFGTVQLLEPWRKVRQLHQTMEWSSRFRKGCECNWRF